MKRILIVVLVLVLLLPSIVQADLTPCQELRRQEWADTLAPWITNTMPAEGTNWYNYIMFNTPLPGNNVYVIVTSNNLSRIQKIRFQLARLRFIWESL